VGNFSERGHKGTPLSRATFDGLFLTAHDRVAASNA